MSDSSCPAYQNSSLYLNRVRIGLRRLVAALVSGAGPRGELAREVIGAETAASCLWESGGQPPARPIFRRVDFSFMNSVIGATMGRMEGETRSKYSGKF